MKMNVALTADELMNVVDATMNEAIDRGFDDEDEELVEDMLAIVDAALSAMGISIVEEEEEEEEDFFDDDDDDDDDEEYSIEDLIYENNGKQVVSKDTADFILNTMLSLVVNDDRVPDNEKWNTGMKIFIKFCEDFGIEAVDMGE